MGRQTVNVDRFARNILEPHIVVFAPFIQHFLLISDNAKLNIIIKYLKKEKVVIWV